MSETTRISEKDQATITHGLREKYDLEPGDGDAATQTRPQPV
ncbi:hypothetical protein RYH80_16290 [Halobaculum sp. MBLA0147]